MIQAHDYEQQTFGEKDLDEFQGPYNTAKVLSAAGKEDLRLLTLERQAHFANRREKLPLVFLVGTPGSGEKLQAEALAKDSGLTIIDVEDVVRKKSIDKSYFYQSFLAECIANSARPLTTLVVGIIEENIKEAAKGGQNWVVVVGFPDSIQQLNGFQRQVQKNTYTILLKSQQQPSDLLDKKYAAAIRDTTELEKYLNATEGYLKVVHRPSDKISSKIKEAIVGFKRHRDQSD
ncbi:hypothetical protein DL98DRAFT_539105 [Cadophora sp. DSE1049]|nr:hypothetical protein DL98DRAFT_539105 [Cadophora sp. DSE1049]